MLRSPLAELPHLVTAGPMGHLTASELQQELLLNPGWRRRCPHTKGRCSKAALGFGQCSFLFSQGMP